MRKFHRIHKILTQAGIGALLGILILHPLTTLVFWVEFNDFLVFPVDNAWTFFVNRLLSAPLIELIPMSAIFALIGAALGLVFAKYYRALEIEQLQVQWLERELNIHLPSLVAEGESERLEFKSTLRWDLHKQRPNKVMEKVIAKTLAGLMNHRGGSLLIGVDDSGKAIGIEADCQTLKHKNTDGFERAIMDLVRKSLGANACALIHCQFPILDERQVCWLLVERATNPIFYQDGDVARYVVRTGNSTRELDAREAHAHVGQRGLCVVSFS